MRTESSDLYTLIRSLSKSEKAYFKKYAARNLSGDSNYLKLFSAMDRDEPADESLLKKKTGTRYLSRAKNYLYDSVLASLRAYYQKEKGSNRQLHDLLTNADILQRKALPEQGMRMLSKASKLAAEQSSFGLLLEIYDQQTVQVRKNIDLKGLEKLVKSGSEHIFSALERYKNVFEYLSISNRMLYFIRINGEHIRRSELRAEMESIVCHPMLNDRSKALTPRSLRIFNNVNALGYRSLMNYDKALTYVIDQLRFQESLRPRTALITYGLILEYGNAMLYSFLKRDWNLAASFLEKLKSVSPQSRDNELTKFSHVFSYELSYYVRTAEVQKGLDCIAANEPCFKKHRKGFMSTLTMDILVNVSACYFMAGDFKKALAWHNQYLNDKDFEFAEEILCHEKLFSLLIHTELKNYGYLEYGVQSVQRYLKKNNRLFGVETALLTFFKKSSYILSESKRKILYAGLHQSLLKLSVLPHEQCILHEFFDYLTWAEAKMKGVGFAELKKQRLMG